MPKKVAIEMEVSNDNLSPMDIVAFLCDYPDFDLEDLQAIAEHLQVEIVRMKIKAGKYDREGRNE